jgi:hypothetical protein
MTRDIISILIGIGVGCFAVICIRIIDYIFDKCKEENNG